MSDKETAPWAKKVAAEMGWADSDCTAPAPQPCGCCSGMLTELVEFTKCPADEDVVEHVKKLLAAASQVTPELELEQEADGRWLAAYTRFPGVAAYGPSKEEAIRNAAKVLIEAGEVERG